MERKPWECLDSTKNIPIKKLVQQANKTLVNNKGNCIKEPYSEYFVFIGLAFHEDFVNLYKPTFLIQKNYSSIGSVRNMRNLSRQRAILSHAEGGEQVGEIQFA